jgi:hypothetical protein
MSTTSKSPKKVARAAYLIAQNTLPDYSHRFSPKKFTLHQLFACIVLKTFLKTDYRGIVAILEDCPDLCKTINLTKVPHFTTLNKAARKILSFSVADSLIQATLQIAIRDRGKKPSVKLAAIDSTGLESGHISRYFVKRRSRVPDLWQTTTYKQYPKLSVVCDCQTHLILSAITTRGPNPDVNQFCKTLMPAEQKISIDCIVADAGYDSETNHVYARRVLAIETIIPAEHGRPSKTPPKGKYRRLMKTRFKKKKYGQRWQVETVFSMIKRNFGSELRGRSYWSQNRDMLLLVLTHNIAIVLLVKELFYRALLTPYL